ncbi:MAG: LysR family transcriptional regulator [Sphingobium sp.]|nr:LysR family transcriptional regulator [Sphingobium sp.]
MQTRLVEYFIALEREGHFARAAASCNVSQPTLSSGISALEAQLGKRLILRDRKYAGLTPEGEAILPWARQLVAATEALGQAAETARGPLTGELRLGVIPAAMPAIGELAEALLARYPGITISVRALTSRQIERELAAFELDAGVTYLDFAPPAHMLMVPLYRERLMLVSAKGSVGLKTMTEDSPQWEDIIRLPLCLLHQGMQNRQILDARLAGRGLALRPLVTADSYVALLGLVQQGRLHSIIPDSHKALLDGLAWADIRPLPLLNEEENRVGVIIPDRTPMGPLAHAIWSVASELRLSNGFSVV